MAHHQRHFCPVLLLWILCITMKTAVSMNLVLPGEEDGDTLNAIAPHRHRLTPGRLVNLPITVVQQKEASILSPGGSSSEADETLEQMLHDADILLNSNKLDKSPKDLIFYTAKIINLLRLKRGFSVISRLLPQFYVPSTRRTTAYQQRAVSDDYFEQEIQTRRTPLRRFRPRLRWG